MVDDPSLVVEEWTQIVIVVADNDPLRQAECEGLENFQARELFPAGRRPLAGDELAPRYSAHQIPGVPRTMFYEASVFAFSCDHVFYAPEFGGIMGEHSGLCPRTSVEEAQYFTNDLSALPFSFEDGSPHLKSKNVFEVESASVFLPWGGIHNYGHFLIDAMSALAALVVDREDADDYVSPPLSIWQRDLVSLFLGPALTVREVDAQIVRVKHVRWASPMAHFLHMPGRPLDMVRDRILQNIGERTDGPERVYLSRRSSTKRVLVNEAALEEALIDRGYVVVDPGLLSVKEQISLFAGAAVIVGTTGAGLANIVFCRSAHVVEIQPTNFTGGWVQAIAGFLGLRSSVFFAPSPTRQSTTIIGGVEHSNIEFEWWLDIPAFLEFLDEA